MSRRSVGRLLSGHKVAFTGGTAEDRTKNIELVETMGGAYDPSYTEGTTTVLVAQTDQPGETDKLRRAIDHGTPVVTVAWLKDLQQLGVPLNTRMYEIASSVRKTMFASIRETVRNLGPDTLDGQLLAVPSSSRVAMRASAGAGAAAAPSAKRRKRRASAATAAGAGRSPGGASKVQHKSLFGDLVDSASRDGFPDVVKDAGGEKEEAPPLPPIPAALQCALRALGSQAVECAPFVATELARHAGTRQPTRLSGSGGVTLSAALGLGPALQPWLTPTAPAGHDSASPHRLRGEPQGEEELEQQGLEEESAQEVEGQERKRGAGVHRPA